MFVFSIIKRLFASLHKKKREKKSKRREEMGGRFIASTWDPHYIIGQIVCMQSLFYFVLSLLLIVFDMSFGIPFSLDQIFLPHSASSHVEFIYKWVTISAYFVVALVW